MSQIDLRTLENRIVTRTEYIERRADELMQSRVLSPADVRFRKPAARFVAEAYFLLSEAYKAKRMNPGARTQEPKIAAFTTLAILAISPFQAIHPLQVRRQETVVANPIFGLYCGSSIIANDFSSLPNDSYRRALNFLRHIRLPCLRAYITDVSIGISRSQDVYDIVLDASELGTIDAVILLHEILNQSDAGSHSEP